MTILRLLFLTFLSTNILFASSLESLLSEYEDSSNNSLNTLNEKMGHVVIYTQEELNLMQYEKLSDLISELPINNLNKNRFGQNTISLTGSKTEVSGFYRIYINDHEISSIHTQSAFLNWLELPISLVDHIEVYYGEGSFTLGNETGIHFIRIYTKSAAKENGNEIQLTTSNKNYNSQSYLYSTILDNGWSYLAYYANQNNSFYRLYNNQRINSNSNQNYVFLNLSSDKSTIDFGYTALEKDNYMGMSTDLVPDEGEIVSSNMFIHVNNYFLDDNSLKTSFSIDINNREYEEKNQDLYSPLESILVLPQVDLNQFVSTVPVAFHEKIKLTKLNAKISKTFKTENNNLFTAINIKDKRYKIKNRNMTNFFGVTTEIGAFNDYNSETIYSFMLQDDYKINNSLYLIGNLKFDNYERDSSILKDSTEYLYRVGTIYLPTENLGFKAFYTKSYIPPSFFNIEFIDKNYEKIDNQEYKYYTIESTYTYGDSKFNIEYYNVHINDFVYFTPIGFINVPYEVKTDGMIFNYDYNFNKNNKLKLNYYFTNLNRDFTNSYKGGYLKFLGRYQKLGYFTSLIYRNGYSYEDIDVDDSFNLNLGVSYNFTKNLSFSIKANNLLDKPTQSIVADASAGLRNPKYVAFDDFDRSVTFSIRWLF